MDLQFRIAHIYYSMLVLAASVFIAIISADPLFSARRIEFGNSEQLLQAAVDFQWRVNQRTGIAAPYFVLPVNETSAHYFVQKVDYLNEFSLSLRLERSQAIFIRILE
jgi:hypothetical protein